MFGLEVTFDGDITNIKDQLREQIANKFEVPNLLAVTQHSTVGVNQILKELP